MAKSTNPEERGRIVTAIENRLKRNMQAPNELEIMIGVRNQAREKVRALLKPIVDHALVSHPGSPDDPHSDVGKAKLLITAHKLYLDELKQFNRDEALFLLAFAYAELTVNEFI
jgi:hypothetical protein